MGAMLFRLLLALLVAALPLPALAGPACHAPPATTAAAHHGAKHEPVKQAPAEMLCLGCVAPTTLHPPALAAPQRFPAMLSAPAILAGLPLEPARPATPPPRPEA
jgi:hypothetical protein